MDAFVDPHFSTFFDAFDVFGVSKLGAFLGFWRFLLTPKKAGRVVGRRQDWQTADETGRSKVCGNGQETEIEVQAVWVAEWVAGCFQSSELTFLLFVFERLCYWKMHVNWHQEV